ncbi:hypothetical protein E2C01_012135 [Portunus trituberculatus]|uniref:Uncharacterized protein n=1 Tax=Portunus trituberculatus TaxID=210409 RepID=A0A5B7DD62_PORTR|nr:hypothetical protein [Portunus trituberculatus]
MPLPPPLVPLPAATTSCRELEEVLGGGTGGVANCGASGVSVVLLDSVVHSNSLEVVVEFDLTSRSLSLFGGMAEIKDSNCSLILASSCASFFGVKVFSRMEVRRTD